MFGLYFEEDGRVSTENQPRAWGVKFPSGAVILEWNQDLYDLEESGRDLSGPHRSYYSSMDDVMSMSAEVLPVRKWRVWA